MSDWIDMRGMTDEQADAALVLSQRDRVQQKLVDLSERLVTIADEAFGIRPVEPIDDTIIRIERGIFALRQREQALEAEVQRLLCWTVGAFVDGEMDSDREPAFRLHLAKCAACQAEVVHLVAMTERLKELSDER